MFKKKNLIIMLILNIITFNVYYWIWLLSKVDLFNKIARIKSKVPSSLLISATMFFSVIFQAGLIFFEKYQTLIFSYINKKHLYDQYLFFLGIAMTIAVVILIKWFEIIFSYRARLEEYCIDNNINLTFSRFYTLIFSIFYLQYKINKLAEADYIETADDVPRIPFSAHFHVMLKNSRFSLHVDIGRVPAKYLELSNQ